MPGLASLRASSVRAAAAGQLPLPLTGGGLAPDHPGDDLESDGELLLRRAPLLECNTKKE